MVFDGAAYYGLPTSAQASSSGSQWQPPYGGLQQGLPNHSANAGQGYHGNKTGSRSIIQRPYSYDAPQQQPNMMGQYTTAAGWPAYPQQWHGQVMQNGQVWQRPSPQQPFYGTMHAYGQQYMQNAGLLQQQPLPPSTPAPSLPPPPPPVMRHALPAKPQFAPAGGGQPASLPKQSMPAVLQPMRPITDQRSPDHRPPRPPPIQDNEYSRPRATQNMYCQVCKMSFPSSIHLIAHQRNEHVKCCKYEEGCEFEALPNIVEIHEQDRHLIFRPGARKEKTKPDGPLNAKIQGTNISLDTEEDIAKWIEERKRKWPGQKNKELKLQQELKRKAYMDASPALQNRENGQQRAAKRSKFSKTNGPAQHPEGYQRAPRIWGQTVSNTQNSAASSANPSSDDEGDAADVAASLTKAVVVSLPTSNDPVQDKIDNSNARAEGTVDVDGNPIPDSVTEPKHLADDVAVREEEEHSDSDSAPEEVHTVKVKTIAELDEAPEQEEYQSNRPAAKDYVRRDCTTWMTTGTCKFGKQCRFSHDPLKKGKQRREPPPPAKNPFERGDIIGKLVHNEIRHEISDLTQVIDFLARNDWLKNVELYPGHKREVEGRIEEVS